MPKPTTKTRFAFRSLSVVVGASLLVFLIQQTGSRKIAEDLSKLGWRLVLVVALGGASHLVKTWAWRLTLTRWARHVSFPRMLQLRLASEAVGQIGALGQLFGEGLRVTALSSRIPVEIRILSVTLDRLLFVATGAAVTVVGIVAALRVLSLTHKSQFYAALFSAMLICLFVVAALAVLRRWPLMSGSAIALGRLRILNDRLHRVLPLLQSVESELFSFASSTPGAFWASLTLNLGCHAIAVLEVYLVLCLLGVKSGLLGAFLFEALTKLVNVVGAFNPGNIGTYEGGNMLIAKGFGIDGAVGLAVAVVRRLRALFWTAIGVVCLFQLSKGGAHSRNDKPEGIEENPWPKTLRRDTTPSLTAVLLTDSSQECGDVGYSQFRVGTLPILLRAVLSSKKAGVGRIIVCVRPDVKRSLQREVMATGRLPQFVEWFDADSHTSLHRLLTQIAIEPGDARVMLVSGNGTYHPKLFQRASQWSGKGALALTSGNQLVGIYVLTSDSLFDIAAHCPSQVQNIEDLHFWMLLNESVQCEPVQEALWQRICTPKDHVAAERKLDQWLVKPTDGIFARMNRKVSVPISRQIIKFPITPNMVSLFTLGVGFAAGLFFACGGYWNMLVGAVLSLWASILDGCDGEVARLKLLESDFGCWLETVCDYLYYLFIFAGIALGLARHSNIKAYLTWTGLFFFGAVATFLVAGLGRLRLAKGRPEQYLKLWQVQAESRRSNPILYFGRHTEFIVRRCFVPYALLFFAVLNITHVAFIMSAIGVNLAWVVSLYSYRSFSAPKHSPG